MNKTLTARLHFVINKQTDSDTKDNLIIKNKNKEHISEKQSPVQDIKGTTP